MHVHVAATYVIIQCASILQAVVNIKALLLMHAWGVVSKNAVLAGIEGWIYIINGDWLHIWGPVGLRMLLSRIFKKLKIEILMRYGF